MVSSVRTGHLGSTFTKRRVPKEKRDDPSTRHIRELEQEIHSLKQKLKQAETIIEVQKNLRNVEYPFSSDRREEMMLAVESLAE